MSLRLQCYIRILEKSTLILQKGCDNYVYAFVIYCVITSSGTTYEKDSEKSLCQSYTDIKRTSKRNKINKKVNYLNPLPRKWVHGVYPWYFHLLQQILVSSSHTDWILRRNLQWTRLKQYNRYLFDSWTFIVRVFVYCIIPSPSSYSVQRPVDLDSYITISLVQVSNFLVYLPHC